jgi:hypothetical protein
LQDIAATHPSDIGDRAGIELRVTPSIWPFWRRVVDSTVEFSGSRLSNSTKTSFSSTIMIPSSTAVVP